MSHDHNLNECEARNMFSPIVLSREQVRMIDRIAVEQFGIPSLVLMENAGRSCAEALLSIGVSTTTGPVCICCGKGNNAGDGFVMARHLAAADVPVEILTFFDESEFSPDARTNFRILQRSDIPIHQLSLPHEILQLRRHLYHSSWVVDALLGTGFSGSLRAPYDTIIAEMNDSGRPILSIDLPSGLDCDLGSARSGAVQAHTTISLVALKPGFQSELGKRYAGQVIVGSIGIPHNLISCLHQGMKIQENTRKFPETLAER